MTALAFLRQEWRRFQDNANGYVLAEPTADNMFYWHGQIIGPEDTPFEGGIFYLDLVFDQNYPYKPPVCRMRTKMFHPNISLGGEICLRILEDDWSPALTIEKLLLSISSILDTPIITHPVNDDAAQCFRTDRHKYDSIVRKYTLKYANDSYINTENKLAVTPELFQTHRYRCPSSIACRSLSSSVSDRSDPIPCRRNPVGMERNALSERHIEIIEAERKPIATDPPQMNWVSMLFLSLFLTCLISYLVAYL